MWYAGVDKINQEGLTVAFYAQVQHQVMWRSGLDSNAVVQDFGLDDTGQGSERHVVLGDNTIEIDKAGRAARPIAAHLGFAAVGVEETPAEIHFRIVFDQDQTIGSH